MHDDDLDRALFALPLEAPPAGLRESILRATVYAPSLAMRFWETLAIGALAALVAWLIASVAASGGVGPALDWIARELSDPAVLVWASLGSSVALFLTQMLPLRLPPSRLRVLH